MRVGFLGYLWNKSFRSPPREDATWREVSLVWNCIPWLAKSHPPSCRPGRGAVGTQRSWEWSRVHRVHSPGELVQGSIRPAAVARLWCLWCGATGCEPCGQALGALSAPPAARVPREQEAREWTPLLRRLTISVLPASHGHASSGQDLFPVVTDRHPSCFTHLTGLASESQLPGKAAQTACPSYLAFPGSFSVIHSWILTMASSPHSKIPALVKTLCKPCNQMTTDPILLLLDLLLFVTYLLPFAGSTTLESKLGLHSHFALSLT